MEKTKFSRFKSNIIDVVQLTENVKHFKISVPKGFNFIPGQYVSIIMDNPKTNVKLRRPYSIVSTQKEAKKGYIELSVKILENGNITPLLDKLKVGDEIGCLGPLGEFKISKESENKNIIFISTGVGIAPFMSMIPYLLEEVKSNKKIKLITGYRNGKDILYLREMERIENLYKNFKHLTAISNNRIRVQDIIEEKFDKNADYYICGLKDMISSVNLFLLKKGILGKNIYTEKYD